MFAAAGFPEAIESGVWSDRMLDAVLVAGPEDQVAARLNEFFEWGAAEVLVSVITVGPDHATSWERTVSLAASLSA